MSQSDIPRVSLDANSPSFGTIDEAADAVSKGFKGAYEQAAIIVQRPDGSYGYSTVAGLKDHENFALSASLPKDHRLAGVVHSHPSRAGTDDTGQYFSPNDLDVADRLKVPSYIRFLKDDSIRKYSSGKTQTSFLQQAGTRIKSRVAKGDPLEQAPSPAAAPVTPPAPAAGGILSQAAAQATP